MPSAPTAPLRPQLRGDDPFSVRHLKEKVAAGREVEPPPAPAQRGRAAGRVSSPSMVPAPPMDEVGAAGKPHHMPTLPTGRFADCCYGHGTASSPGSSGNGASTRSPSVEALAKEVSSLQVDLGQRLRLLDGKLAKAESDISQVSELQVFCERVSRQLEDFGQRLARVEVESATSRETLSAIVEDVRWHDERAQASPAEEREEESPEEEQAGQQHDEPHQEPSDVAASASVVASSPRGAGDGDDHVVEAPEKVRFSDEGAPDSTEPALDAGTSSRSSERRRSSLLHKKAMFSNHKSPAAKSFAVVLTPQSRGRLMLEDDSEGMDSRTSDTESNLTKRSTAAVVRETLTFASKSKAKYCLKESVWDASLFTGYAHMGLSVNIMLGACLVLNITMQVALCAIVALELARDVYDDNLPSTIAEWRKSVGDALAKRVCKEDYALSTESLQVGLYTEARDFTVPWLTFMPVETGPVLAGLVIFMWTLTITDVLRDAVDFMLAAVHLHRACGSKGTFFIGRCGSDFVIEGVTRWRIAWALIVGMLQLGIAISLLLSGSLWLAHTKSIPDLLANAVALSYILQVDELIYQVLVPTRAKALVTNVMPIDMSKSLVSKAKKVRMPHGIPKRALLVAAIALTFLIFVVVEDIEPNAVRMRELKKAICPV